MTRPLCADTYFANQLPAAHGGADGAKMLCGQANPDGMRPMGPLTRRITKATADVHNLGHPWV